MGKEQEILRNSEKSRNPKNNVTWDKVVGKMVQGTKT